MRNYTIGIIEPKQLQLVSYPNFYQPASGSRPFGTSYSSLVYSHVYCYPDTSFGQQPDGPVYSKVIQFCSYFDERV